VVPLFGAAEFKEKLLVSKRTAHKSGMERFHLKKVNYAEVKEQYQVKISN
jgi:hypothetical protein